MNKRFKQLIVVSLAFALALSLAGCGVNITSVGLPTELALDKGAAEQLTVSYGTEDEAAEEKIAEAAAKLTLEWASSDEGVATVDQNGVVTAVGAGTATITASIKDANIQSVCAVTVTIPLEGVKVDQAIALALNSTDSAVLKPEVTPADATDVELKYESSDPAVAAVSADGKVTAAANGECIITTTATADGAEFKAETAVKVDTAPASLSLKDTTLTIGCSGALSVAAEGENITVGTTYTWASGDESIVTVDSKGAVKGVGIGSAAVTVTNEIGQSAACTVTVKNIVCAYCGQEGHGSNNCEKKRADEAAAEAQRIAAEQAAAQAAEAERIAAEQAAQCETCLRMFGPGVTVHGGGTSGHSQWLKDGWAEIGIETDENGYPIPGSSNGNITICP